MRHAERIIAIMMLGVIGLSNIVVPVSYAAPLVKFHYKVPVSVPANTNSVAQASPVLQPAEGSVLGASTSLLTVGTQPLDLQEGNSGEAVVRIAPRMEQLAKKVYEANEDVILSVINPDDEPFSTTVTDAKGKNVAVPVTEETNGTTTTVDLSPSDSLRPGRYTVSITDTQGQVTTQDFTWGVLAMNFDKVHVSPGRDRRYCHLPCSNDQGNMVCDAELHVTDYQCCVSG